MCETPQTQAAFPLCSVDMYSEQCTLYSVHCTLVAGCMIFCVERLLDFLCGKVAGFSGWRSCVILRGSMIFCVERLRHFLCGEVA